MKFPTEKPAGQTTGKQKHDTTNSSNKPVAGNGRKYLPLDCYDTEHIKPSKVNQNPILDAALDLHALGFWIVPCRREKKKKPVKAGWPDKRLSKGELRQHLIASDLNIAFVINQSDWIDVECDSDQAEANLQELFGGMIPPTPTWKSSRGYHRLFVRPAGLPKKAKIEIDGVEFRIGNGKGALSTLPPSIHVDGTKYEWVTGQSIFDIEPAVLPAAIVDRLKAKPKSKAIKPMDSPITKGERNNTLFLIACQLRDTGVSADTVKAAVLSENQVRCDPPLPDNEVFDLVRSAMTSESCPSAKKTASMALLGIAEKAELWCEENDTAFATFEQNGHVEHWSVRSRGFKNWLGKEFYVMEKKAVASQTLSDVLNTLEGRATFDGETHPLFMRTAGLGERIYVDLVDDDWRAIEIDADGWRIVDRPPVRFRRAKAMLPLPVPVEGGSVDDLRRFVNVTDEHWPLLLAWLVASYRPTGPYPILKLLAEQGSGKTTAARVLRSLVDPNGAPVRSAPRGERDLMIAANNGWVICLDNLSWVDPNLSDTLCRLATGGGFATRTLYENDEETIIDAQRPVILNGIEDIGFRSDLIDRSLMIELPRIEPSQRLSEKIFWREYEIASPGIMGALLDTVSAALGALPAVEKSGTEWPRMADFAMWAVAAEESLGLAKGEFLTAYERNRETANEAALESSPVYLALRKLLVHKSGTIETTATNLLDQLGTGGVDTRAKGWPKNAARLSGALKRLAPNLRRIGITAEQDTTGSGKSKRKVWRIIASKEAKWWM